MVLVMNVIVIATTLFAFAYLSYVMVKPERF